MQGQQCGKLRPFALFEQFSAQNRDLALTGPVRGFNPAPSYRGKTALF
jgi:hypothetical protein